MSEYGYLGPICSLSCTHVVEFLKGSLLGLRNEEEDHHECTDVQTSVKALRSRTRSVSVLP